MNHLIQNPNGAAVIVYKALSDSLYEKIVQNHQKIPQKNVTVQIFPGVTQCAQIGSELAIFAKKGKVFHQIMSKSSMNIIFANGAHFYKEIVV